DTPQEYYLLENRLREGADAKLPGDGLLVWHVDERVNGFRTAQQNPAHKLLHLVEADGRGDLDRGHAAGGNRGDATDPWQGPPAWRRRLGAAPGRLGALGGAAAGPRLGRGAPWAGAGARRDPRAPARGRGRRADRRGRRAAPRARLRSRYAGHGALRGRSGAGGDPEPVPGGTRDALRRAGRAQRGVAVREVAVTGR